VGAGVSHRFLAVASSPIVWAFREGVAAPSSCAPAADCLSAVVWLVVARGPGRPRSPVASKVTDPGTFATMVVFNRQIDTANEATPPRSIPPPSMCHFHSNCCYTVVAELLMSLLFFVLCVRRLRHGQLGGGHEPQVNLN
jgi:hypothetical protein